MGKTYTERQRERVACGECGTEIADGSMSSHMMTWEERHQSAVFYADNRMVVSSDPAWLQGAFSALVAIFDRVGLRKNANKTVSMACHPCRAGFGNRTTAGYSRRLMGVGKTFK